LTAEILSVFWGLVGFAIGRLYLRQVEKRGYLRGYHAGLVKAGELIQEKLP